MCEIDLCTGWSWHFEWRLSNGIEMECAACIERSCRRSGLSPPSRGAGTGRKRSITLTFSEEAGKTTVTLTILYLSKEARDAALQTGMKEGMSLSFDLLAEYLRKK